MTGDELKAARKGLGLTQEQFAERLGLEGPNRSATVRSWESGRRPVSSVAAKLVRYMQTFGLLD